jgi:hypothetical protein
VLRGPQMDRKRTETERPKAERRTPSQESIQERLDGMAESVRNLQTDADALIKRPNVLPWRKRVSTDKDQG